MRIGADESAVSTKNRLGLAWLLPLQHQQFQSHRGSPVQQSLQRVPHQGQVQVFRYPASSGGTQGEPVGALKLSVHNRKLHFHDKGHSLPGYHRERKSLREYDPPNEIDPATTKHHGYFSFRAELADVP